MSHPRVFQVRVTSFVSGKLPAKTHEISRTRDRNGFRVMCAPGGSVLSRRVVFFC